MKTALTLLTAIIVPGGLIVLGIALVGFVLARHRKSADASALAAGAN
ncbi:MAG: hypothetical protein WC807_04445 [Hyphomicrobium sp.]|jgi:hypothetical protein